MDTDIVVDDLGRVWPTSGGDLSAHLGVLAGKLNLGYLVRVLGFVRVRLISPQIGFHISFNPGHVMTATIQAVVSLLVRLDAERVVAEAFGVNRLLRITTSIIDLIDRMEGQGEGVSPVKQEKFFRQPLDVASLETDSRLAHLRGRYQLWRQTWGRYDQAVTHRSFVSRRGTQFFAAIRGDTSEFVHIGKGYHAVAALLDSRMNRAVHDQPDLDYGHFVHDGLFEVRHGDRPILEVVEAVVILPDEGTVRLRYHRLMLPWKSPGGGRFVSSATIPQYRFAVIGT